MTTKKPIIIYDNRCLFCIRTKNFFDKLDKNKNLQWKGIDNFNYKKYKRENLKNKFSGAHKDKLYEQLKKEDLLEEMYLISGNKVYKGYYAFKQISKKIPLFFIFYFISLIPGIDYIGNKIYNIIAKHRYKI